MLIIAEALPVSEPVPAVVGTAIIGDIFLSSALDIAEAFAQINSTLLLLSIPFFSIVIAVFNAV